MISRANVLAGTAMIGAAAFVRFPAEAAQYTLKLGTDASADHPLTANAMKAADAVKQQSNGQIEIRVFPNSLLGNSTQLVAQARSGATELILIGNDSMANVVPIVGYSEVPFSFTDYPQAWGAMDGPFGQYLRRAVVDAKAGLSPFDKAWDLGFRQIITGTHGVTTPADIKGLKIRTPVSPLQVAMYKALGAVPTTIPAAEMYAALQTHVADGADLPLGSIKGFKIYEILKDVALTNHIWTGYMVCASTSAWEQLPKDLRDVVAGVFNTQATAERNEVAQSDATFIADLTKLGVSFNKVDVPSFRTALKTSGAYAQWRDAAGPTAWSMLESVTGKLE